ncbi:TonB-dependent receptor plug domain-containing protein [Desulfonema magnum]|uniref:TonB-dependent receptor domain-containing protein n=1 Tax=Desulfonema magnum TaxID=45655 RepID=A0A975BG81_9BACT|nr:TonB-dependent receptor [Desulfonema magnum]QTA84937.1 TonB-dependent receptor domain-containing protein [Desulfonema magnum]
MKYLKTIVRMILMVCIFIFGSASGGFCQDIFSDKEAERALDEELRWLRTEAVVFTEIATKTKVDADLAPGMVTVLDGTYLENMGTRTVGEALTLVPGLDLMTTAGSAVIRGFPKVLGSGKVKIMLNHIPVNSASENEALPIYFIPVGQISRIEVIRGPGSALYGKSAYSGVINVITQKKGNRIYGQYGSFDTCYGGFLTSYANPEKNFHISLNLAGWKKGRTDVEVGSDTFGSPGGPINDARKSPTGVFTAEYRDFSLLAQWTSTSWGDTYGTAGSYPELNDRFTKKERTWQAQAVWDSELSESLNLKLNLGVKEYLFEGDRMWIFPAGVMNSSGTEMLASPYYDERTLYGSLNVHWKGWKGHHLLAGVEYERNSLTDAGQKLNYDPVTFEAVPYQNFTGEKNWLEEDKSRDIFGALIQEQFEVTDWLTINGALRYDIYYDDDSDTYENYDDTKDRFTPRLATVFKASDHHIFKLQYAEAFRSPGFFEMYSKNNPVANGNPDVSFEVIRTYEMEYIFRTAPFVSRFTLFKSELEDLIITRNTQYTNSGGAEIKGAEIEFKWHILPFLTADSNLSYMDTKDNETGDPLPVTSEWLGNIGLACQPAKDWSLFLRYRHVGKRSRIKNDPFFRASLKGYDTFDVTTRVENIFTQGLDLLAGVKNLSDDDTRYPSRDYPEDISQTGREWWVQISYEF